MPKKTAKTTIHTTNNFNNSLLFSEASLNVLNGTPGKNLATKIWPVHVDLQRLMCQVIKFTDIKLICGYRDQAAQDACFDMGTSKLKWPDSKHNKRPSLAIDWEPYPKSTNIKDYIYIAGIIMGIARFMKLKIRYGYDWNQNDRVSDETFVDAGHTEIII